MKPDDPIFNIQFLNAIEKHEILWNSARFGNNGNIKKATEKAWNDISDKFDEPVYMLRELWRNLRTAFFRSIKTSAKKPYYLSSHLQFLLKTPIRGYNRNCSRSNSNSEYNLITIDKTSESSMDNLNQDPKDPPINISYNEIPQEPSSYDFSTPGGSHEIEGNSPKFSMKTNRYSSDIMSESEPAVNWIERKKRKLAHQDADLYFLKSLLPHIKKLTDRKNRNFRQKVLAILDDLLEEEETQQNRSLQSAHTNTL